MTNSPLVSVIVPCYNQGQYLAEALDSVLAQTYTNWECIIVNDGSTDRETEPVAQSYVAKDKRFKYLKQENGGPSLARNNGIESAEGPFILPLDADDLIGHSYLEKAMEQFENTPSTELVYCFAKKFGNENGFWHLTDYSYKNLLSMNCIFCSAIFKKARWKLCGGYDANLLNHWEDWDFWIKLLDKDSIVYKIPETLFFYRTKELSRNKEILSDRAEKIKWDIVSNNFDKYSKAFLSPQSQIEALANSEQLVSHIKKSYSYRLGNALLKPFSYLKNMFDKHHD